jgi:hypothetical protein
MRRIRLDVRFSLLIVVASFCAALLVTAALAQSQRKPPAPPKPYKPVTFTLPRTIDDPSFEEFRRQIAEIAAKRDRNALARLVVAQGFFWRTEKGEKADKNKSGLDNLASAIQLDAKDDSGWDTLAGYAFDSTGAPVASLSGAICAPADPVYNDKDLEKLLRETQTDLEEWGYPRLAGIEVRSGQLNNSPVIDKLGQHFVRVLADESAANAPPNQVPTLKVVTPAGKTGWVPVFALAPLGNDQLCYRKEADGWKITGYVGGEP